MFENSASVTYGDNPMPPTLIDCTNYQFKLGTPYSHPEHIPNIVWEMLDSLSHYDWLLLQEMSRKFSILHKFSNTLVEQTEDLDPKIVTALKDKFWDLI